MSRNSSEQRAIRIGLSAFLTTGSWSDITYQEGWNEMDIDKPLVNVYVIPDHKVNLELGAQSSVHKLFEHTVQIDVFMESEERVKTICEDIMDYLDSAALTITDLFTTSGIGYLSFPKTESIVADFLPPSFNDPEILRWRGSVRGDFESYYPNGGDSL